ncbi:MAG TPA: metallophosphoesterase [Elusimicrobiota bacterium]|nr:metallophosphoesterase [Elusimicrobiota bacterium]
MSTKISRKDFIKLVGLGGVAFASGLGRAAFAAGAKAGYGAEPGDDFFFVQLSDPHWGFTGPKVNPEAKITLPRTIAAVNALKHKPDFIVFTGDLTHTTDDDQERRERMKEFKRLIAGLKVKDVKLMPGEHDAALDEGAAFKEVFQQETHYTFDHKGIHFIVLDNVSDPHGAIGGAQLDWLQRDLAKLAADRPIVVFTHRPLFDLAPQWDWATQDGAKALALLQPFAHVTVFYGHIHQELHTKTGNVVHHAAKSLIFPLPAPNSSAPKSDRTPVPWNPAKTGLGWRVVDADPDESRYTLAERPCVAKGKA